MTREEASVIIGNIPIEGDDCYTIAEYQEAKAMAIKALEQIEIWNATTKDRQIIAPKGTFRKIWEDEQQQKTGHWIDADDGYPFNAICSSCNRLNHLYGNYCKHCGAKMVEPQKSEDEEE